jgi:group I intron endonuclease
MEYYVYVHTNKLNGKKYIGITSQNPKRRWRSNGQGYIGQAFYNAVQKYGWDNFTHDIIAEKLVESDAKTLEQQLIAEFKTTNSKYGYNVTAGGESNLKYLSNKERLEAIAETKRIAARKYRSDPDKYLLSRASQKSYKEKRKLDQTKHEADLQAARIVGKVCREKVKVIRQQLRTLYSQQPEAFCIDDYKLAFGFTEDKKSYLCNSIKVLAELYDKISSIC